MPLRKRSRLHRRRVRRRALEQFVGGRTFRMGDVHRRAAADRLRPTSRVDVRVQGLQWKHVALGGLLDGLVHFLLDGSVECLQSVDEYSKHWRAADAS